MKAFYITIAVFTLMLVLVSCNSIEVSNFATTTSDALSALEFSDSEKFTRELSALSDTISNELDRLEFSLPHKKANQLRDLISQLMTQAHAERSYEFEITRGLILNQLSEIADLERVSLRSIF